MTIIETEVPPSLFPGLEPLLARVSKPIQYVGGDLNSVTKDWAAVDVRWCLMYPDAYEVGLPTRASRSCTRSSTSATGSWLSGRTRSGQTWKR